MDSRLRGNDIDEYPPTQKERVMIFQQSFKFPTKGRGLINITGNIDAIVTQSKVTEGLCNIFVHHTSASVIICENADIDVQRDLEAFMGHLIPDGDRIFSHVAEGPDDMPAHVRTVLTQSSINIPITQNRMDLGTWQGIFLWEHRLQSHQRKITVTVQG
jgi:secondary thiamine-phosphate synthase enzyme